MLAQMSSVAKQNCHFWIGRHCNMSHRRSLTLRVEPDSPDSESQATTVIHAPVLRSAKALEPPRQAGWRLWQC